MNTKFIFGLIILFLSSCVSHPDKEEKTQEKKDSVMLVGKVTVEELKNSDFKNYFSSGYSDYTPQTSLIEKLKEMENNYSITVVLATWCSDSQEQVPHFFKIIDLINSNNKTSVICVNRKKQAEGTNVSILDIQRVPTFIFYRDGEEIGRIIETPTDTLEKDMLTILTR
ncbi:MAG: thioredoxin family protein [Bacteroidota bacterium]|nr:thioredoxin family protein [Bacteroidota bacterium]